MISIYKITSPNGSIYIGQTKNVVNRKIDYSSSGCRKQPMLYNSIRKYGWINHIFEIIDNVEDIDANDKEVYYIALYDSFNNGMNLTPGGKCYLMSKEQKIKISRSLLSSNNIKAKRVCQYTIDGQLIKCWEAVNDVYRELGFNTTAISYGIKNKRPIYGYIWSYNGYYQPSILKSKLCKMIYQYTLEGKLIQQYNSITEAVNTTGINRITIQRNLKKHSSRSFIWSTELLHTQL